MHSIDPCHDDTDAAEPIEGVTVTSDDGAIAFTDSTGGYELEDVRAGNPTVTFAKTGFLTFRTSVDLDCGEDEVLDAELLCLGDVGLRVFVSTLTDTVYFPVAGTKVEYSKPLAPKAAHYGTHYTTSGTTDATGVVTLSVPIFDATGTFTVIPPTGIAETGTFTWTQMINDPANKPNDSIFGGDHFNSRVINKATEKGKWFGFDDGSCANIGSSGRILNNQGDPLVLCAFATVAGRVTVGGLGAPGRLVEVIMNGMVVGSGTTGTNGTYLISGIPTGCFSAGGCDNYSVRCMGWTKSEAWEGCGDVERVDFPF